MLCSNGIRTWQKGLSEKKGKSFISYKLLIFVLDVVRLSGPP